MQTIPSWLTALTDPRVAFRDPFMLCEVPAAECHEREQVPDPSTLSRWLAVLVLPLAMVPPFAGMWLPTPATARPEVSGHADPVVDPELGHLTPGEVPTRGVGSPEDRQRAPWHFGTAAALGNRGAVARREAVDQPAVASR